jgi:hypothetical protein
MLFYNLACCESQIGRTADALAHLRRAGDMAEEVRRAARDDSDFEPIRHERAFKQLTDT